LVCQAQLISSFENNLSSSVGATWEGPGIPNSEFVPVGATDGAYALAIHHDTFWSNNIPLILNGGLPLAQAVASHDFLTFDVTTADSGVAGDGWSPAWQALWVIINSNQGGWHQPGQIDIPVASDDGGSFTYNVVFDLNNSNIKADAQAYVNSGGGANAYFQLLLPMIGGDQGTPVKAGDYGSDNVVNASDYVTWRKSFGGTTLANETVSPGSVDTEDYAEWRAHFGKNYSQITTIIDNVRVANAGSGSGALAATGVPEPSSAALILTAMLALAGSRRAHS
jgi:hypothetical protein